MGGRRYGRVSVYYPRGVRTGGPEALHQLVDSLRRQGAEAGLVPIPGTEDEQRVPDYAWYDAPEFAAAFDSPDDAIVTPEIYLGAASHRRAQVICWWLSIDNSPMFLAERLWNTRRSAHPDYPAWLILRARLVELVARRPWLRRRIRGFQHIAQSRYAAEFVRARVGVDAPIVSDYVTVSPAPDRRRSSPLPVVSYNGSKGGPHASRLPQLVRHPAAWIPIKGMTSAEVRNVLECSDVFVDLGHQPGKDRMPREAAVLGAIALVANIGAGGYADDFPLADEYKVPTSGDMACLAAERLDAILDDLARHRRRQQSYRELLATERDVFDAQVREVFIGRSAPR